MNDNITFGHSISNDSNFLVSIKHNENFSWQGTIQWLATGQVQHFRSFLEMVMLMGDVMQSGKNIEDFKDGFGWIRQFKEI